MNTTSVPMPPAVAWYRQAWPWILIALPLTAVICSSLLAYEAVSGADVIVDANYYRHGLAINEELARADRARKLGLVAQLKADGLKVGDAVTLDLTALQSLPADATIRVRFEHPTRPMADRTAILARRPGSDLAQFVGTWHDGEKITSAVEWRVVIDGSDWRLEGEGPDAAGAFSAVRISSQSETKPIELHRTMAPAA